MQLNGSQSKQLFFDLLCSDLLPATCCFICKMPLQLVSHLCGDTVSYVPLQRNQPLDSSGKTIMDTENHWLVEENSVPWGQDGPGSM